MKLKQITSIIVVGYMICTSTISINANNKSISIEPIFTSSDGLWYPSRIESKDFHIKNNEKNNISIDRLYIQLKSIKDLKLNQLLDKNSKKFKELSTNSTIKLQHKNKILFQDKLDNLLSENGIVLEEDIYINSNEKALLNITIDMNEEMGNYAQSLENIFSIGVAYKIQDNNNPDVPGGGDNNKPDSSGGGNIVSPNTDVNGNNSNKLPQTGGIINSASLIALGAIAIGTGAVLNKKSKGGDKYNG